MPKMPWLGAGFGDPADVPAEDEGCAEARLGAGVGVAVTATGKA
jgi:hypothetical protein